VGSGQWAVGSGQWAVGSGQWAVGSGQWAVGSGQEDGDPWSEKEGMRKFESSEREDFTTNGH